MPQTYYDFDPWKRAADNIASGMVAVAQARNRKAMFDAEMQQRAPLVEAQTRNYNANAAKDEYDLSRAKINDKQDEEDAAFLEANIKQNADGTYTMTPETFARAARVVVRKSKNATDFTGSIENLQQAGNYLPLEQQKINKPVEMNEGTRLVDPKTGKTIAVGNTKLSQGQQLFTPDDTSVSYNTQPSAKGAPPRASTSQGNVEFVREARQRAEQYHADIRDFERQHGTPDPTWKTAWTTSPRKLYAKWEALNAGYKQALADMHKYSGDENNSLTPPGDEVLEPEISVPESIHGFDVRKPFPSEDSFFKSRKDVAGMAAEDGKIVLNPYSPNTPEQQRAVATNEAVRLWLRQRNVNPTFDVTPEQSKAFAGTEYGKPENLLHLKHTLIARWLTGDNSAPPQTEAQKKWTDWVARSLPSESGFGNRAKFARSRMAQGASPFANENNSLTPPPTQAQGVNTPAAAPAVNDKAAYADKLIQAFNATLISDPAKREAARKKLEDMLANLGYTLNSTNAPAK